MSGKPPTTIPQQLAILESRGLVIKDKLSVHLLLEHVNYFRFCCYSKPFQDSSGKYLPGTTFEQLWEIYCFDRHLRILLLDAIERCEISFRTRWAYELAHLHGPQGYENPTIYKDQQRLAETMTKVDEEIKRSKEDYMHTHQVPGAARPPIWAACEVISLGHLSSLYGNLLVPLDRETIAKVYDFDEKVLKSFLHHLTIIRNLCAHHCRIWNRQFTVTFKLPNKKPANLASFFNRSENKKIYNSLVMLAHWLNIADPGNHWSRNLIKLIQKQSHPVTASMGFPSGWASFPIWKIAN